MYHASRVSGDEDKCQSWMHYHIPISHYPCNQQLTNTLLRLSRAISSNLSCFTPGLSAGVESSLYSPGPGISGKITSRVGQGGGFLFSEPSRGETIREFISPSKNIFCFSGYSVRLGTATSALPYPVLAHLQAGYSTKVWAL